MSCNLYMPLDTVKVNQMLSQKHATLQEIRHFWQVFCLSISRMPQSELIF